MKLIEHKFKNHQIEPDTEILIIGTFNPEAIGNAAEYFYGRSRNHLWKLLPHAFDHKSLVLMPKNDKVEFSKKHKIDFTDLIKKVYVEEGQERNYDDNYLDSRVNEWTDIISILSNLQNIKKVCFTRRTFSGIPNMKKKIIEIESYCKIKKIEFTYLLTPARFYNLEKQEIWNSFLNNQLNQ